MNALTTKSISRRALASLRAAARLVAIGGASALAGVTLAAGAEEIGSERLSLPPSPHWVWVNDVSFDRPEAGRAALVDGDTGRYLGWLSTGVFFLSVTLPRDYESVYAVETYLTRAVRGTRQDVVTRYDPRSLLPVGEIELPPKRATGAPTLHHAAFTDDDRFLLIYNFTPATSVSVVDRKSHTFVGEIATPGCVLVYPDGALRFHMLCGDGGMLAVEIDAAGRLRDKRRVERFFDAHDDPIQEDAVRLGSRWLHVSYGGYVHAFDFAGATPIAEPRWSLVTEAERAAGWRTGGLQLLAAHATSDRLFVLMHQGGAQTQEEPGTEVWVFDRARKARLQRVRLKTPATSITVTGDAAPLLFAVHGGSRALEVYDAGTGSHLRTVADVGATPTVLVTPHVVGARAVNDAAR